MLPVMLEAGWLLELSLEFLASTNDVFSENAVIVLVIAGDKWKGRISKKC